MSTPTPNAARPRRRLRYSVLSLLALTTLTCAVLSWLVWPKSVDVNAQVMASTFTASPSGATVQVPEFVDYQARLSAAFAEPEFLNDAVAVVGNGKLAMLRGKRDPANWLRRRLKVEVAPNSIISIQLKVPERFQQEGVELVDYILFRAVTQIARDLDQFPRSKWPELVEQRDSLALSIDDSILRLDELSQYADDDAPEIAELRANLNSQIQALKRLDDQFGSIQAAEDFVSQLRFVQMATVAGKS